MGDPKWYDDLPHEEKDNIDQGIHWSIDFLSAFIIKVLLIPIPCSGIAINLIAVLLRELVYSGKINRPGATVKDIRIWMTGAILGELLAFSCIPIWWTF